MRNLLRALIAAIRTLLEEIVSKTKKRNHKAKPNGLNGAEHRGLEPASPKISESPRSVVADRETTSPLAQTQMATSSSGGSIGTKQPSSLPSSSGPLDPGKTADGKREILPSFVDALSGAFGTKDQDLILQLLLQVNLAAPSTGLDPAKKFTIASLRGIAPRDALEGMMASQMVIAHNQAMELYRQASLATTSVVVEFNLNLATKLVRTFLAQMEGLDRHRIKDVKKMNLERMCLDDGSDITPVSHQRSLGASAEDHGKANGKSN
jgi:hypothetical protein